MAANVGDDHRDLLDEAPRPLLARLERADYRVPARPGVLGGVAVGGVVAAADVAAGQADAQVQPGLADRQAVDAAVGGGRELGDQDGSRCAQSPSGPLRSGLAEGQGDTESRRPGRESSVSEPSWRSTTTCRAVASPSPVPRPTSFVVKNESNTLSRISFGNPGTVVGDLDDGTRAVAAGGHGDRALRPERVNRVVEQVGPHLVELGAAGAAARAAFWRPHARRC